MSTCDERVLREMKGIEALAKELGFKAQGGVDGVTITHKGKEIYSYDGAAVGTDRAEAFLKGVKYSRRCKA